MVTSIYSTYGGLIYWLALIAEQARMELFVYEPLPFRLRPPARREPLPKRKIDLDQYGANPSVDDTTAPLRLDTLLLSVRHRDGRRWFILLYDSPSQLNRSQADDPEWDEEALLLGWHAHVSEYLHHARDAQMVLVNKAQLLLDPDAVAKALLKAGGLTAVAEEAETANWRLADLLDVETELAPLARLLPTATVRTPLTLALGRCLARLNAASLALRDVNALLADWDATEIELGRVLGCAEAGEPAPRVLTSAYAQEALAAGDHEDAVRRWEAMLQRKKQPGPTDLARYKKALMLHAEAARKQRDFPLAAQRYHQVLARFPQDIQALAGLADIATDTQDWVQAERAWEQVGAIATETKQNLPPSQPKRLLQAKHNQRAQAERIQHRSGVNLNVGCGNYVIDGFISLDIPTDHYHGQSKQGFVHYNIREDALPYSDESVDTIYISHVVEHIEAEYVERFVAESFRVLKQQGVLRVACPDAEFLYQVSRFENDYWHWRRTGWFQGKHSTLQQEGINPTQFDCLVRELATPKCQYYINRLEDQCLTDESLLSRLSYEPLCAEMNQGLAFRLEHPGDHISTWDFTRLAELGQAAGFRRVLRSKPRGSVSKALQGPDIDKTHPEMSLYVEFVK